MRTKYHDCTTTPPLSQPHHHHIFPLPPHLVQLHGLVPHCRAAATAAAAAFAASRARDHGCVGDPREAQAEEVTVDVEGALLDRLEGEVPDTYRTRTRTQVL